MTKGLENLLHEERLNEFRLSCLEKRRLRGYHVTVFQYLKGTTKRMEVLSSQGATWRRQGTMTVSTIVIS